MKTGEYIPKENIETSSTKEGLQPADVLPGGEVWTSTKTDSKPQINIILGDNAIPTKSVKLINTENVKKFTVVFVLSDNTNITKVLFFVS